MDTYREYPEGTEEAGPRKLNMMKEIRRARKLRGLRAGERKAVRFYNLLFGYFDKFFPDLKHSACEYRRYRGMFRKTRPGKYFNKDYDWNNRRIERVNRYIWNTEVRENDGVCRIFRKKARGLR